MLTPADKTRGEETEVAHEREKSETEEGEGVRSQEQEPKYMLLPFWELIEENKGFIFPKAATFREM